MFCHSTTTASRGAVLLAALPCSLSLAGVAAAQAQDNSNTSLGAQALQSNTTGDFNTAIGFGALLGNTEGETNTASGAGALAGNISGNGNTAIGFEALAGNSTSDANTASGFQALLSNTAGFGNTASGSGALESNTTGSSNTAIGASADVAAGNLTNATAIGRGAVVDASNKLRLGNTAVTVIEGQVAFTSVSDKTTKENFRPVDGEAVLRKIRGLELSSWNFIGHDPHAFRHYGPMAQDFLALYQQLSHEPQSSCDLIRWGDRWRDARGVPDDRSRCLADTRE